MRLCATAELDDLDVRAGTAGRPESRPLRVAWSCVGSCAAASAGLL